MILSLVFPLAALAAKAETAKGVLDAAASAYAHCRTYRDHATMSISYEGDAGAIGTSISFMTAFVRPGRFRFECVGTSVTGSPFRFVLWRDGDATHHWSSRLPGVRNDTTFSDGITGASAPTVSNHAAQFVPSLLLPDSVPSWGLGAMEALTLTQDTFEKHDCWKVEGKSGANERTLWIDKATSLIRRVEELTVTEGSRTRRTVTYEPAFDQEIDAAQLAPGVPEGK